MNNNELHQRIEHLEKHIKSLLNEWALWGNGTDQVARQIELLEQALKGDDQARKYDWSVIPDHVEWMATDEDGIACGWLVEPNISGNAWRHHAHHSAHFFIQRRKNPYQGDWKHSLEKKPGRKPMTATEAALADAVAHGSGMVQITPSGVTHIGWDLAAKDQADE